MLLKATAAASTAVALNLLRRLPVTINRGALAAIGANYCFVNHDKDKDTASTEKTHHQIGLDYACLNSYKK
jgi:hypothetical protein